MKNLTQLLLIVTIAHATLLHLQTNGKTIAQHYANGLTFTNHSASGLKWRVKHEFPSLAPRPFIAIAQSVTSATAKPAKRLITAAMVKAHREAEAKEHAINERYRIGEALARQAQTAAIHATDARLQRGAELTHIGEFARFTSGRTTPQTEAVPALFDAKEEPPTYGEVWERFTAKPKAKQYEEIEGLREELELMAGASSRQISSAYARIGQYETTNLQTENQLVIINNGGHKQERTGFKVSATYTTPQHEAEAPAEKARYKPATTQNGQGYYQRLKSAKPSTERHTRNALELPTRRNDSTYQALKPLTELPRQKDANDPTQYEALAKYRVRVREAMSAYIHKATQEQGPLLIHSGKAATAQTGTQKRRSAIMWESIAPNGDVYQARAEADNMSVYLYRLETRDADEAADLTTYATDKDGETVTDSAKLTARMLVSRLYAHETPELTRAAIVCRSVREAHQWHSHFAKHVPVSPVRNITTAHFKKFVTKPTYSEAWSEDANSDEFRLATHGAYFTADINTNTLHTFTTLRPESRGVRAQAVSKRLYDAAKANGIKINDLKPRQRKLVANAISGEDALRTRLKWEAPRADDATTPERLKQVRDTLTLVSIRTQRQRVKQALRVIEERGKAAGAKATVRASKATAVKEGATPEAATKRRSRAVSIVAGISPDFVSGTVRKKVNTSHAASADIEKVIAAYVLNDIDAEAVRRTAQMVAAAHGMRGPAVTTIDGRGNELTVRALVTA